MKEKKIKGRKMKQKLISLIALLAIGALLAGCLAPSEEEIEEREPIKGVDYQIEPAEPGWNWYINKYAGFKIKYPTDWKNFKAFSPDGFWVDDPEEDGYLAVGRSSKKEWENGIRKINSSWDIAKRTLEFKKDTESYCVELLELTNFTLNNVPATKLVCAYVLNPEKWPFDVSEVDPYCIDMEIGVLRAKNIYCIRYYNAPAETFDKYSSTLDKIINSFTLI
jgi:hypothetical protein